MRGYVSVDVDIDDVISSLSVRELQQLVDELYEDGYVAKKAEFPSTDDVWNDQIGKLSNNRWRLSEEDQKTILQITNKII
jgi:hypothetical protein